MARFTTDSLSPLWNALLISFLLILPVSNVYCEDSTELCSCSNNSPQTCSCQHRGIVNIESVVKKYCNNGPVQEIDLSYNNISTLGNLSSWDNGPVQEIDLSYNNISTLGNLSSWDNGPVQEIDLSYNNISTLGNLSSWDDCSDMRVLTLRGNNITSSKPSNFAALRRLEVLDVGNTNLTYFGDIAFSAVNRTLKHLLLDHNLVRIITKKDFAHLSVLRKLNLSFNRIGYIQNQSFVECCPQLESLNLYENYLTDLEVDMFLGLDNLKDLDISHNPIKKIPIGTFTGLSNLERLNVTYRTNIHLDLPTEIHLGAFKSLNNLRTLNMSDLRISHLAKGLLSGLAQNLQELYLVSNQIESYAVDVFEDVPALEVLSLRRNYLRCIQWGGFRHLSRLRSLDLSHNRITYLHSGALLGLTRLQELNVMGNPVMRIHSAAACPTPELTLVHLTSNMIGSEAVTMAFATTTNIRNGSASLEGKGQPCNVSNEEEAKQQQSRPCEPTKDGVANCIAVPVECEVFVLYEPGRQVQPESRIYLLVIIAICISFLLVAFLVILSYRAWSKRRGGNEASLTTVVGDEAAALVEMHPVNSSNIAQKNGSEHLSHTSKNSNGVQYTPVPQSAGQRPPNGTSSAAPPSPTSPQAKTTTHQQQHGSNHNSADEELDTIVALGVV